MNLPFSVRRLLGRAVLALSLAAVCASTPGPVPDSVTIVGTFQSELGCAGDWEPACAQTHLERNAVDGVWRSYFVMPEGFHDFKAALNDNWEVNYGANATRDGGNIRFGASEGLVVKFFYDPNTHWVTSSSNTAIAVAAGTFQKALGCTEDWQPGCMLSWLTDEDGDTLHRFKTTAIPAGPHRMKVAHNESWDVNYGADGVEGGEDIHFTVPAEGQETSLVYNPFTHRVQVQVAAPTRTTLTVEPGTVMVGETVTFTAHVEVTEGTAIPAGTVTFRTGTRVLDVVTLNPGSGTATWYGFADVASKHPHLTATYEGMYQSSTSEPRGLIVGPRLTATLRVSPESAFPGQPVTLTAKVTAADPNEVRPTGRFTFRAGDVSLGTVELDAEGQAVLETTFSAGTHALTAAYSGDSRFLPLTSSVHMLQVGKADSATTLTVSKDSAVYGEAVTFTATVAAVAPAVGSPTGDITFRDGDTVLGTASLSDGVATFTTSRLTLATHAVSAEYAGNDSFHGGTSEAVTVTVGRGGTSITLEASPNPSVVGQVVTLSARVAAVAPSSGTPQGSVTFKVGDVVLRTVAVGATGEATLSTLAPGAGTYALSAEYSGEARFTGSLSADVSQQVRRGATSIRLSSTPNPSTVEQAVTLSAEVSGVSPATGTPGGQVRFKDGNTVLGSSALDAGGRATFSTTALASGSHALSAEYVGDERFEGSSSSTVTQGVARATSSLALTSSTQPSVFGQAVSFTAQVAPGSGLTRMPGGSITFRIGSEVLGIVSLGASGRATLSLSDLEVGTHALSASYSGDARFEGSTAPTLSQVVNRGGTTVSLASSLSPSVSGQSVTLTARVAVVAPAVGAPSGEVVFKDGSTVLGTGTLDASGEARLNTAALAVGTHLLTAEYAGDARFSASTSQALSQTVDALAQPDAGTPTDGGTTTAPDAGTTEPDAGTPQPDGGTTTAPDAGTQPAPDAGSGSDGGNGGCGCGATDGASAGSLLLVVWMGLSVLRRRTPRHG